VANVAEKAAAQARKSPMQALRVTRSKGHHDLSTTMIENLEKLLDTPRDGPLLRFSLGHEYMKANDAGKAVVYFRAAVGLDPAYSAAWKQLGHALLANKEPKEAVVAWQQGVQVAEKRGDKQAAKEMTVFLKRTLKQLDPGEAASADK